MPSCIVVILLILPWNVGLSEIVFVGSFLIGNFIDEGLNEFNEVS